MVKIENIELLFVVDIYRYFGNIENVMGNVHAPDSRALKSRWRDFLQEKNLNTTQQRELIVEQFLKCHGHVSIDELLAKVRKRNNKIGYATVYRTLKLLVESGVAIQRNFSDTQTRFEVERGHHDHLICEQCGLIVEFEDDEIEILQDAVAKRLGEFSVVRHRHELYVLCAKARGVAGGVCPNEK